ncbi:hypothetical protein A2G94_01385 [Francisella endosymbiont of Ornithodoros moubata]|nr:hypothetical protein A2G94_01385 [Francisella endosymbiont of Ornithodoros moubata]
MGIKYCLIKYHIVIYTKNGGLTLSVLVLFKSILSTSKVLPATIDSLSCCSTTSIAELSVLIACLALLV